MNQLGRTVYLFGPFRYDSSQRQLYRRDDLVPLVPKAIDTLQALLEHRGQVVGRSELMKLVWPDCVVEEIGLARNISLLRKALGDDEGQYIETIPKRGYRFAVEVDANAAEPTSNEPCAASPAGVRGWNRLLWVAGFVTLAGTIYWQFYRPSRYLRSDGRPASLAVLPFEDLSPELDRDAWLPGLSEALVEELSKLPSVQLTSPSTIRRYRLLRIPIPVMARLLGLDVIVEQTAQKLDQQLRIAVRMTDVHSGKLIWADRFDVPAGDPGQAQLTVARAVTAQIDSHLR